MNNFLQQLVDRSLSAEPLPIRPWLPGPFEPVTGAGPGLVESPPEQEIEEETRPRRVAPQVEAHRETEAPGAMLSQPRPKAEEHPTAIILAPKPEPQISNRRAIEPAVEGRLEERPSAAQPAERGEPPQPEGRIEYRPAPERPPDRDPTPRHEPRPELLRPAPARAVVRPQPEESRPALLDLPRDRERPRAAPIEPVIRLRRDEPEIAKDGGDIISAVEPPSSPPSTQSNRAPAEQPPIPRVQVSIGRVEVRAVFAPPPVTPPARQQPGPGMSLDDYLKQRDGGS
jgi:hypothetical protein